MTREYYEYDINGNKVYSEENNEITTYRYDGMNRLFESLKNETNTVYDFDCFNNISKEHTIKNGKVSTKSNYYDISNHLILSETPKEIKQYDYDLNGNLKKERTNENTTYYSYDGYNRLNEIIKNNNHTQYTYEVSGMREKKITNDKTTRFINDGTNISGEIGNGEYTTYYRGKELIGYTTETNEGYYYRQNTHGDVIGVADYQGKEIKTYSYTDYGKEETIKFDPKGDQTILYQWESETSKIRNPFKYCGEYTDKETGFLYLRNRYYDPSVGRFISEDPIKSGFNWYSYCAGNPIMFVDPWGLAEGDFLVNNNTIGYTQEFNTGTYGSARDYVTAMGGKVGTVKDGKIYMELGNISFKLDISESYGKATVYKDSKGVGTIQYTKTIDKDNTNCAKMLINLNDITTFAHDNGYNGVYTWDLGNKGGTLYRNVILGHLIKDRFIPKEKAANSFNPDSVIVYGISEISPSTPDEAMGDFISGIIYGSSKRNEYNKYLSSGKEKFIYIKENSLDQSNFFSFVNYKSISVDPGNIGIFYIGNYN